MVYIFLINVGVVSSLNPPPVGKIKEINVQNKINLLHKYGQKFWVPSGPK